jgi:hypothetical protein
VRQKRSAAQRGEQVGNTKPSGQGVLTNQARLTRSRPCSRRWFSSSVQRSSIEGRSSSGSSGARMISRSTSSGRCERERRGL